jgi:mutator protein MutT
MGQERSEANPRRAVVFVFYDEGNRKVLLERRPETSFYAGKLVFPGGAVESAEKFEETLLRETTEEMGVKPLEFSAFNTAELIVGETGVRLNPFLITRWQGQIPQTVLDKGNELIWIGLDEFKTDLESVRRVFDLARTMIDSVAQSY